MKVLLHPSYFPTITTFGVLARYPCIWETEDNYQKQTYRNRCYVCTDQGRHMLNIPIVHVGGATGRQRYKDVRLDNSYPWQRQHWKTLQTAYRTSPFFEYYEDEIAPIYQEKYDFLLDYNLATIRLMCDTLDLPMPGETTTIFEEKPGGISDARYLIDAKSAPRPFAIRYRQVFGDRHGFVADLSILDLLFNTGNTALSELLLLDPLPGND